MALSPQTAMSNAGSIEQLTYLLFLKMADEGDSPLESMVL
ncbi:MAG: Type I restriction-modification system, DNA-methyltransferase subunit M [Nitrospira sp.]|nr:MAG: Type I restriction-modification system, DNA-methyltransferase subunit M [Nitrospira sp.]